MFGGDRSTLALVLILIVLFVMVAVAGYYLVRLIRSFRLVHSRTMPLGGKLAFWAALAYLVFPVDVLPDPVLIDDIALLAGAVTYIQRLIRTNGIGLGVGERPAASSGELDQAD